MKKARKSPTFTLCLCSLSVALSVTLMQIGVMLEIADMTCAMIAATLVWFVQMEFGGKYSLMVYTASALLGFLLLGVPYPAFYYLLLFGWYPIVKHIIDRKIRRKRIRILFKFPIFILAIILEEWLAQWLLGYTKNLSLTLAITSLCVFMYLLYDILLTVFAIQYFSKWRKYVFKSK